MDNSNFNNLHEDKSKNIEDKSKNIEDKSENLEKSPSGWDLKLFFFEGEDLSTLPPGSSGTSCSEFSIKSAEIDSINNLVKLSWEKPKNSPASR